ncbi:MAG: UDP-3-O-acyl-N-acetylglucosamine deacetylase, partial [Holosporales bacterium]|nr:UDP-3-O-acyl-N-acetylglucosamine deacetylase [Holosporales bacterium]
MRNIMQMEDIFFTPLQGTVRTPMMFEGIGAHSGCSVQLVIKPAAENTGILFVRTDLPETHNIIPAHRHYVSSTTLCTTLSNESS